MSLGPREATVKLTLGGVVSEEFYARYEHAVLRALQNTERWLETLELDIPEATGELRRNFQIEANYYGQEKSLKVQVTSDYGQYVLEFGRRRSQARPPWQKVRTWAIAKGVDLRKARAWWWKYSKAAKVYRSPRGKSLQAWWSEQMLQLKYVLEAELKNNLTYAGFSPQDVKVTYQ